MADWLRSRLTYANVGVTVALVLGIGGFAFAAIPGPHGVIRGCYQKKKGSLRVVAARGKCSKTERAITWNQRGAPGVKGNTGDRGAQGLQGIQGVQGLKGDTGVPGPGAVTLSYSNNSPSSGGSPPVTTLGTAGPFTLKADCTLDGSDNVGLDLIVSSTASYAVELLLFSREDDAGGVTTNQAAATSVPTSDTQVMSAGATVTHFKRYVVAPLLLHAGTSVVNVNVHILTDARPSSRSCQLDGQAVPSG